MRYSAEILNLMVFNVATLENTSQSCVCTAGLKFFIVDKMQLNLIFLFGIALYRTTVASLIDKPISECTVPLDQINKILEDRLSSFGETLHGRLMSLENRLTQSECSKSSVRNGGSPSFDYGSRVRNVVDNVLEIIDARVEEKKCSTSIKIGSGFEKSKEIEKNSDRRNSIVDRLKDIKKDLNKIKEIREKTKSSTTTGSYDETESTTTESSIKEPVKAWRKLITTETYTDAPYTESSTDYFSEAIN